MAGEILKPELKIDDFSEEQTQAIDSFVGLATTFSEPQLLSAMEIADRFPGATGVVLPLTSNPDKVESLFESWREVVSTRAFVAEFDKQTENTIENDVRFKDLIAQRRPSNQEENRSAVVRLRFAIFAGRMAVASAEDQSSTASRTGQLSA